MKINLSDVYLYIILSLALGLVVFMTSIVYKSTSKSVAERERDIPTMTYLVKCPNVPDTQVTGTSVHTNIVGSDHIHIYDKDRVVGMFPPQCVVSAQ